MGILGIKNRTENWKTAEDFSPFFRNQGLRLSLVKRLGEPDGTDPAEVRLELFWKGVRDHLHQNKGKKSDKLLSEDNIADLADCYTTLFPDLRNRIEAFRGFKNLQDLNYDATTSIRKTKLANNLLNTEIDIVLETPHCLFIGEAKDESSLDADGTLVLVHQLIRQYVMAKVLVHTKDEKKKIVPFVVGNKDRLSSIRNTDQVRFMKDQGWLEDHNVLSWDYIEELSQ